MTGPSGSSPSRPPARVRDCQSVGGRPDPQPRWSAVARHARPCHRLAASVDDVAFGDALGGHGDSIDLERSTPAAVRDGHGVVVGRVLAGRDAQLRGAGGQVGQRERTSRIGAGVARSEIRVQGHIGTADRLAFASGHDLSSGRFGRSQLDAQRIGARIGDPDARRVRGCPNLDPQRHPVGARFSCASPSAPVNTVVRNSESVERELAVICAVAIGQPLSSTTVTGSGPRSSGKWRVTSWRPPSGTETCNRTSGWSSSPALAPRLSASGTSAKEKVRRLPFGWSGRAPCAWPK